MTLSPDLHRAIEQLASGYRERELIEAAAEVSDAYRGDRTGHPRFLDDDLHRVAYAIVRMPATYAAVSAAFAEVFRLASDLSVDSVLDLGAGPGTVAWVLAAMRTPLPAVTGLERDPALVDLARSLVRTSGVSSLASVDWRVRDVTTGGPLDTHDVVVSAYALNELPRDEAARVVQRAWDASRVGVIFVEPGTMDGFDLVRTLRAVLLDLGAHPVAPCPHGETCPVRPGDWCHFAARFPRSSLHRKIKGGTLSFEDEKYSYIAAFRDPVVPAPSRILRHPTRHAGHVHLELCTPDGLREETVTRSRRDLWREGRKASWGDAWH